MNSFDSGATPLLAALRGLTLLGAAPVTAVIAVVAVVVLARAGRGTAVRVWLATFIGTGVTVGALKVLVHRVRPTTAVTGFGDSRWSFPSGHAALAAVTYGLIGYFAVRACHTMPQRIVVAALVVLLVLAVGVSRVALGMHYVSDVAGGLVVGAIWAGIAITALERARRRSDLPARPR